MSVSMEALAMAGADYLEWGLDEEEWERQDSEMDIPPHLLAEEGDDNGDDDHDYDEGFDDVVVKGAATCYVKVMIEKVARCSRYMKMMLRTINVKCSEIAEIFDSIIRQIVPLKQLKF